jgi:hypothetical protein
MFYFSEWTFSELLPTRPSASDINCDMSDCNLLTFRSPLAKLVSTLGPVIRSPNFVRPCIYNLFRKGPLPPDIICAVRAAGGTHKWSLNFVKGPAVLKRVVAPPPPPTVFPLHNVTKSGTLLRCVSVVIATLFTCASPSSIRGIAVVNPSMDRRDKYRSLGNTQIG